MIGSSPTGNGLMMSRTVMSGNPILHPLIRRGGHIAKVGGFILTEGGHSFRTKSLVGQHIIAADGLS
jgi:hypothetical protein